MERACLICRSDLAGCRSDARFCSARCRKRWHRQPADLRVEFVSDPWLPPSDDQIRHERNLLASACRQTRTCNCDSPVRIKDVDGHDHCLKCSWPLESGVGRLRLRQLFRLIARFAARYSKRVASGSTLELETA